MSTSTVAGADGLSVSEALALPVMFDIWPTVGRACHIGRTTTYQLAREGALPIPVVRVGRQFRARRSDLLAFLGLANNDGAGVAASAPSHENAPVTTSSH
jgi:excisionase family DNA binding protein